MVLRGPLLLAGLLLWPPLAGGQAPGFQFTDPAGDVLLDGRPFSGRGADTNDILLAGVREEAEEGDDAGELVFELELKDLAGLRDHATNLGFHAQYAVSFKTRPDHEGYSVQALFGGLAYTGNPLGGWRFMLHDLDSDEWRRVEGRQDGSILQWEVDKSRLNLTGDEVLTEWSATAWNSYGDGTQSNDGAQAVRAYEMGGRLPAPPSAEDPGAFAFLDDVGDVSSGSAPVSGRAADTADVVSVRLSESGDGLVFVLELRDLSGLRDEARQPGFHAQYAVGFQVRADHAGYSTRALFGGEEYSNRPEGGWRFQLHDRQADEWADADGRIEGSTLVWTIPRSALSVEGGDGFWNWTASTWNSYDSRAQYGDHASTQDTHTVGPTPEAPASAAPEPEAAARDDAPPQPLAIPAAAGALAVLALVGLALLVRRRIG